MRTIKRLFFILIVLVVLLVAGLKWGLNTQRGQAWLSRRLSAVLARDVRLLSADLCWPGALHISGLQVDFGTDNADGTLHVRETRIGWRGTRWLLELRRPLLVLGQDNGRWEPAALAPLTQVSSGVLEALESCARSFRDRWDLEVRDARVLGPRDDGENIVFLHGLRWSLRRVDLPGRPAWHQRAEVRAWAGGPELRQPATWEWLSLEDGHLRLDAHEPAGEPAASPAAEAE